MSIGDDRAQFFRPPRTRAQVRRTTTQVAGHATTPEGEIGRRAVASCAARSSYKEARLWGN